MATVSFTLKADQRIPVGTSLDVYAFWDALRRPGGVTPVLTGQVMTANGVTLAGLQPDTEYIAGTEINGVWRAIKFRSPLASSVDATDAVYRELFARFGYYTGSSGSTAQYLHSDDIDEGAATGLTNLDVRSGYYLDPADLAANERATKLRLRVGAWTNPVAPTRAFTIELRRVATLGGVAGDTNFGKGATVDLTAVAQVTLPAPGASSMSTVAGAEIDVPAAGWYVVAVQPVGGSLAATSNVFFQVRGQIRHV